MLQSLEELDWWPEVVKEAQRGWIGRSEGAQISFQLADTSNSNLLTVFTTRPETVFGVTFIAVSHENFALINELTQIDPTFGEALDRYKKSLEKLK